MDPKLRDLLREVANNPVTAGETYTHVTTFGTHGRWLIGPQKQSEFWSGYCDLVNIQNGDGDLPPEPTANMCLGEKISDVMPLISKLTFRYHVNENEDNDGWEPYDDAFIQRICYTYQTILAEHFRLVSPHQLELVTVVLESSEHWYEPSKQPGQKYMLMEIRIQFPYARIDVGLQNRVVRPRVIQALRNNNVMSLMQRQPIGDWDQIISPCSNNESVIMYGSSETVGRPKLKVVHIWPVLMEDSLASVHPNIPLRDAFVPQNHSHVQQLMVDQNIFEEERELEYWLPMFLSLNYWPAVLLFRNEEVIPQASPLPQAFGSSGGAYREEEDNMEKSERLIAILDSSRFLREPYWLDIGKSLYHSDNGGENGLLSWIRHSDRASIGIEPPLYMTGGLNVNDTVADTCRGLYYTFASENITIETLGTYAKEDSPERYADWHKDWCLPSMEKSLSGLHADVAESLYKVYWLEFAYCPIGKGRWFHFRNQRWIEMHQGITLKKLISHDFMRRYEVLRANLNRQISETEDVNFKNHNEITCKRLTSLIGKLKTVSFKNSIMTEVSEYFSKDNFLTLLDRNPDLTGVSNGILAIHGNTVIFRKGKPEDYMSMNTNNRYNDSYSWEHPLVQDCMRWLGQVFTNKRLLHHFLKFSASCLKGRNSDKIFPIWTGGGDNSKSMVVKLFESTLSSYCIKFPVAMLNEKVMNASGPTPQLARAKATRIAFLDEPEDDIPMQKGTIKRYSGGDSFFARQLHDNGQDFEATFKMVLMCNKVPIIPNADKAIKNRTRIFPFRSTWVDNAPESEAEQYKTKTFQKNTTFEKKIPIMAPAFLWIMVQYYPYYAVEGLADPPIVTKYTENYWKDNDLYAQFAADTIQEVYTDSPINKQRDAGARESLSSIYAEFKIWFRDAFPGVRVPERQVVKTELTAKWGRMAGNGWPGIRIMGDSGQSATASTSSLGGRNPNDINIVRVVPVAPTVQPVVIF